MNDARLTLLVNFHLDGQLSAGELCELEDLLRGSAAAREQFWREARLHALLHEAEKGAAGAQRAKPALRFRRRRLIVALAAAAACLALLVVQGAWPRHDAVVAPGVERTTTAIAVLAGALDARWADAASAHAVGDALEPGWLRLTAGLARVELHNGVRLVLEGPVAVRLISGREAQLDTGRLSAEVPTVARGFTVRTPRLQVVDLGTSFGVLVDGNREELHVFKGRVTLQAAAGAVQEVHAGEAMDVVGDGLPHPITADPAAFQTGADLARRSDAARDRQAAAWRQAVERVDADPALLVHVDFDQASIADRAARNRARHGAGAGDGTIIGCAQAEGRWAGRRALEFRTLSDRVRLLVPGEHVSLSLVAWVRVDALDRPFNSLFMTDAFEVGAVHWQVRGNGSLHLGVSGPPGQPAEPFNFDTPGVFSAARIGRWTQVALVYDGDGRRLTHYVDGQPAGRYPIVGGMRLRIGHAELGNWNPGDSPDPTPIRNLSGRMDEFLLFTRALGDQEVDDLYRAGAPAASAAPEAAP